MHIYRISATRFSRDLSGEGARLSGGRWNHKLTPCVYCSESRALAVLEYTVNVNIDEIPRALSITTIDIPEKNILTVSIADLPGNWKDFPAPDSTKNMGSSLLKDGKYAVIKIPSAILPLEYNYILNPLHRDSNRFAIIAINDFVYDIRIKEN